MDKLGSSTSSSGTWESQSLLLAWFTPTQDACSWLLLRGCPLPQVASGSHLLLIQVSAQMSPPRQTALHLSEVPHSPLLWLVSSLAAISASSYLIIMHFPPITPLIRTSLLRKQNPWSALCTLYHQILHCCLPHPSKHCREEQTHAHQAGQCEQMGDARTMLAQCLGYSGLFLSIFFAFPRN